MYMAIRVHGYPSSWHLWEEAIGSICKEDIGTGSFATRSVRSAEGVE